MVACESPPRDARDRSFDPDEAELVMGPAPAYSQPPDTPEWPDDDAEAIDPEAMAAFREQVLRDAGLSVGGISTSTGGRAASRAEAPVSASSAGGGERERWTIAIASFDGPSGRAMAEEGLRRVRSRAGLTRAFVRPDGEAWTIAYGGYDDARSERAQRDLERVRSMEIDGARPFSGAMLAPPKVAAARGEEAAMDLRHAKARYGTKALYTLQVGAYGLIDGAPTSAQREEIRASAERAATELRREGELAFFYHAPNRSMVTVGVLTSDDHDPDTGLDSARLRALRERFPHNLFNGAGIRESAKTRAGGKASRLQPSVLVAIPER